METFNLLIGVLFGIVVFQFGYAYGCIASKRNAGTYQPKPQDEKYKTSTPMPPNGIRSAVIFPRPDKNSPAPDFSVKR